MSKISHHARQSERIWMDKHIGIFFRINLVILLKGFPHAACDSRWLDLLSNANSLSDKISPLQWFSLEHILKYLQFMQGRHNKKRGLLPSSNQSCQDDLNLLPSQIYPSNSNTRAASVTYSACTSSAAEPERKGQITASAEQSMLLHERQPWWNWSVYTVLVNDQSFVL